MKPLSETDWREKLIHIVGACHCPDGDKDCWFTHNAEKIYSDNTMQDNQVNAIVDLILSDRKAWGEYVIGEDIALAFRTHPLESTGWLLGFVSVLVILCIVLTNRLDIIVTLSDELYQAIPKVFK